MSPPPRPQLLYPLWMPISIISTLDFNVCCSSLKPNSFEELSKSGQREGKVGSFNMFFIVYFVVVVVVVVVVVHVVVLALDLGQAGPLGGFLQPLTKFLPDLEKTEKILLLCFQFGDTNSAIQIKGRRHCRYPVARFTG